MVTWISGVFSGKRAIMPLPLIRCCLELLARGCGDVDDENYDFLWQVFLPIKHLVMKVDDGGVLNGPLKKSLLRSGKQQLVDEGVVVV